MGIHGSAPRLSLVQCLDDNLASEFVSRELPAAAVTKVEQHLAGCRDCRQLVAALAGDEGESDAVTRRHDKVSEDSQVTKRPVLSIGDRVGRYLVLASLGSGGMGVVFTAYDPHLDRKIALKLLRGNLGVNAKEARARLKREAQAIAQLNHPNVVGVYDVGTTAEGDVYIAMEFVEGDTLSMWLKRWPRTWREILDVFHQAGRGLIAAHTVGLLHRDFKPDNVLVGADGRVRVTDFGLARSVLFDEGGGPVDADAPKNDSALAVHLTAAGTVLGTPRYMPPEHLTGSTNDARADQFSFCVALYEALYGNHPLKGATSVAMLDEGAKAAPPPTQTHVPAALGRAVMRGLEKDRQKRFPTMAALMQELTPPPQRSSMKFIAIAALFALLVTGTTAWLWRKDHQRAQNPRDEAAIKLLYDEIRRLNHEIEALNNRHVDDARELEQVKHELDAKIQEMQNVTDELIKEKAKRVKEAQPIVAEITSEQMTAAIQSGVGANIQFALADLDSRAPSMKAAEAPQDHTYAAIVRLSVKPDGTADGFSTTGIDYSPATRTFIEDALKRVSYPKATDPLDVRVTIHWKLGTMTIRAFVAADGSL